MFRGVVRLGGLESIRSVKPEICCRGVGGNHQDQGPVQLNAVGAAAVNQAVKAITIARGFVAPNGIDLVAVPAFLEIEIDGEERTAIRFIVMPR